MSPRLRAGEAAAGPDAASPGPGVSAALARERSSAVRSVAYDLTFHIPADRAAPVHGRAVVRFTLQSPRRVVLDFAQPERVQHIRVAGADVPALARDGHLILGEHRTRAGENSIEIEFVAGEEPMNRGDELLYTLFVPARAHRMFPCFDQPDLRATVSLTLDVPAGWEVAANGAAVATERHGSRTRTRFEETRPIPTYLLAFVAGKLAIETASRDGREMRLLHRETDAGRLRRNRDAVFDLHAAALAWLEEYTGVPYPFGKFDVVAVPAFQFSGMEHPGAIFYNAASILLDPSATQNQMLDRASLIAHETAHMWFGNLVTMGWFDDVWLKEVLANVMAAKIVRPLFPDVDHELRFFLAHYPPAYQVDRTAGANPIRQDLANLDEAGQIYGPIIYRKAPIVMRQLEMIVGEQPFRDGLRDYLKAHAFGNAAWPELLRALAAHTSEDLGAWSRAWIDERGRPTISAAVHVVDERISRLTLTTTDPLNRGVAWPQQLRVVLGYPDGMRGLDVSTASEVFDVPGAAGLPLPQFVLPSGGGLGYGLFLLDEHSSRVLLARVEEIPDPLTRGAAWVTLWDNMLEGRLSPQALLGAVVRGLAVEADEQNVERLLAYATQAFWRYLGPDEREALAPSFEDALRRGMAGAGTAGARAAWFAALRDVAFTGATVGWMEQVWRRSESIPGLTLSDADESVLAMELAVRGVRSAREILEAQHARIGNPDRRAQFAFVMPALSPDPSERAAAFDRLIHEDHGRREPWALQSLSYLNHPLREGEAVAFIRPCLERLEHVQRTGDIFFPMRWLDAVLHGHRSPAAASIVRDVLARQTAWPERLRWLVLTAADELFRAADLQSTEPRAPAPD